MLHRLGVLSKDEAGAIVHARQGKHGRYETCKFCAIDGRPVLASLERLGLAHKAPEGDYAAGPPASPPGPSDELPKGF